MKSVFTLLLFCFAVSVSCVAFSAVQITGSYSLTSNLSSENSKTYYFGHKLLLNLKPENSRHSFDFRDENYSEASFHGANPDDVVVENKSETQLSYNFLLNEHLTWFTGILSHSNYTFRDSYSWYLTGISANLLPWNLFWLSAAFTALKRGQGGRIFYDGSLSIEKFVFPLFSIFCALHRYENFGESDLIPSKKMESEVGVNHTPSSRFSFGLSYFKHTQDNDPLDRFSAYRVRATYTF